MAKPEWGTKRVCQSCPDKFYDFGRLPIICPSCGVEFDPEAILKSRRGRTANREKASKEAERARAKAAAVEAEAEAEEETELDGVEEEVEGEEAVIEDADDLGDDDEDLGDVPVSKKDEEES